MESAKGIEGTPDCFMKIYKHGMEGGSQQVALRGEPRSGLSWADMRRNRTVAG